MPTKESVATELRGIFALLTKKIPGADLRLLRLLNDAEWDTRLEVVQAIHKKKWVAILPKLIIRLEMEDEPQVREALEAAIADLKPLKSKSIAPAAPRKSVTVPPPAPGEKRLFGSEPPPAIDDAPPKRKSVAPEPGPSFEDETMPSSRRSSPPEEPNPTKRARRA
jgi:hypothetical protein